MGKIWGMDLPHAEMLVLLALADHADHLGERIWPSLGLVAWKTGYSLRQVRRIMRDLEGRKILTSSKRRPGKPVMYKINVGHAPMKMPFHPYLGQNDLGQNDLGQNDLGQSYVRPTPDILSQTPDIAMSAESSSTESSLQSPKDIPPTPLEGEARPTTSKRLPRTTRRRIPDDFQVTPEMHAWADEKAPTVHLVKATEAFIDYHGAKGSLMLDWRAAWQTWIRNARDKFNGPFKPLCSNSNGPPLEEPARDSRGRLRPTTRGERETYYRITPEELTQLATDWPTLSIDDHYEYGIRMPDDLKTALAKALGCQRSDLYLYGQEEIPTHAS